MLSCLFCNVISDDEISSAILSLLFFDFMIMLLEINIKTSKNRLT